LFIVLFLRPAVIVFEMTYNVSNGTFFGLSCLWSWTPESWSCHICILGAQCQFFGV